MVAVVILAIAINGWLYLKADMLGSLQDLLFTPELVLLFFGIDLLSVLFHELGHASTLRRAGARYGTLVCLRFLAHAEADLH
jgi:hypothetical protein